MRNCDFFPIDYECIYYEFLFFVFINFNQIEIHTYFLTLILTVVIYVLNMPNDLAAEVLIIF